MGDFFRFPHTPHLAWLGPGSPRDDKVLPRSEADALLGDDVVVEEKVDGANVGISLDASGTIRVQNRRQYLREPYSGQFRWLGAWLLQHESALQEALRGSFILFGEWCAARHSLEYDRLPDWLLAFDVYDREEERFFSTERRNGMLPMRVVNVREVYRGRTTLADLEDRLQSERSRYRRGPAEGFVIRRESGEWLRARAKLVRPEFVQQIGTHWSRRHIDWNRLDSAANLSDDRRASS